MRRTECGTTSREGEDAFQVTKLGDEGDNKVGWNVDQKIDWI